MIADKEAKALQRFTEEVKKHGVAAGTIDQIIKKESFAPKPETLKGISEKVKEKMAKRKSWTDYAKEHPHSANKALGPSSQDGDGVKTSTTTKGDGDQVDPKRGVKGTLICKGVKTDSEVIYWRDVPGDATFESPITPHHGEHHDTYITFRYDMGGWNNIRMGIEIMVVTAHAMGRTLVNVLLY